MGRKFIKSLVFFFSHANFYYLIKLTHVLRLSREISSLPIFITTLKDKYDSLTVKASLDVN